MYDRVQLVKAAARRAKVRTREGNIGTLVYAPGTRASISDEERDVPRHGDREQCGVRFPEFDRDTLFPVPVEDIVEIIEDGDDGHH
jgi:hypothetical protein